MKSRLLALALLTSTAVHADEVAQQKAARIQNLYQTGMQAMKSGDRDTARQAFQGVLKLQPGHGHARYQLATLDKNVDRAQVRLREQKFQTIKLKQVAFDQAGMAEALEALDRMAGEASDGSFTPNFILQDPGKKFDDVRITLQLRNVPVSVVLHYILQMSKGTVRYDEHATVVMPRP
ncbi:MAG: hypothetical protein ACQKBY_12060 [Verrucomicrobiales bacterium]